MDHDKGGGARVTEPLWDAIVAGDLFVDLILTGFPSLPRLGEEGFASECHRETGGGVANTACGLAALGLRTAAFAVAGRDELDWFRQRFAARGVDTSLVAAHPEAPSAITVAVSTPRDRIFYTYSGANALLPDLLGCRDTWLRLAAARHVHFALPVAPPLLAEMGEWLRARGASTSIDVGWQPGWLEDLGAIAALRSVDWFLPNESEARRMTGETDPARILAWFHERGARGVALKLGPAGSAALAGGQPRLVPSIAVRCVDTTGAGDCFNAGFLYGVARGMPIERALRCGNICGALSTEKPGGIAGFPKPAKVRELLG
jgi:sugar/nucleoside kinase (ribokinase family)